MFDSYLEIDFPDNDDPHTTNPYPPLGDVDITELSNTQVIRFLDDVNRSLAHFEAIRIATRMEIVRRYEADYVDMEDAMDAAEFELRAAEVITRRSAKTNLNLAEALTHRLPNVLASLRVGLLDLPRARVIANRTLHLDVRLASSIAGIVLPDARSLTTGELKAWLDRLCIDSDPAEAGNRFEEARADRCIWATLEGDGTATITALGLKPDTAVSFMDHLSHTAKGIKTAADLRTHDQIRVDVFEDIVGGTRHDPHLGTTVVPGGREPIVDISTHLSTLLGIDEKSITIPGFGPVLADIGRQIAIRGVETGKSQIRFTVSDDSGERVVGVVSRRATAEMRRLVENRDRTCIFIGCRAPAQTCDLDHRTPYSEGGPTQVNQLAPLCRHDHVQRHKGWQHETNPTGTHTWLSPMGNAYTAPAPP